jgi:hypothetical protein
MDTNYFIFKFFFFFFLACFLLFVIISMLDFVYLPQIYGSIIIIIPWHQAQYLLQFSHLFILSSFYFSIVDMRFHYYFSPLKKLFLTSAMAL